MASIILIVACITLLIPQVEACGTAVLRAVSACFAVACVPLFYALAKATSAQRTEQQALLMVSARASFGE